MKGPSKLITPRELPQLMEDLPATSLTRSTLYKSDEKYQKQSDSVARRRTNASVVGIILLERERIALVHREGSHSGWALPSGSLKPYSWLLRETFRMGLHREMREELGIRLHPEPTVQEVEERTFINTETGAEQSVYVATFVGRVALGEEIRQTRTATREGLIVRAVPLDAIPELVFGDNEKVDRALSELASRTI